MPTPRARWLAVPALAALGAALAPGVLAQSSGRVPTVGVLTVGPAAGRIAVESRAAFEAGLREAGWAPGQSIAIEYRYAEGRPERLEGLARELTAVPVDVLVARSTPAIGAARRATAAIPIVMSGSGHDPVHLGFVASLGRPGGNVTGLSLLNQELPAKQLELLKELDPRVSRVAVLGSRALALPDAARRRLEAAARALGVELHTVDLDDAADLDGAFARMARAGANGVLVRSDPFVLEPRQPHVVALAAKHRLPAVYWLDTYVDAGGLVSYGADLPAAHKRSAYFVDRLLRGARAAELPVEEPSTLSLVVHLKTARALGLAIPPGVLARTTRVVQ